MDASQYTTSIQVYDSLGRAHTATMTLQKQITGGATPTTKWRFDITIPNKEVAGVAATDTNQFSLITGKVATTPPTAGGAVESSNVDMASELTKIITFQRAYQANAELITVTDQIMQETMNLKQ